MRLGRIDKLTTGYFYGAGITYNWLLNVGRPNTFTIKKESLSASPKGEYFYLLVPFSIGHKFVLQNEEFWPLVLCSLPPPTCTSGYSYTC